jgi:lysophospholipase L1-like esterase
MALFSAAFVALPSREMALAKGFRMSTRMMHWRWLGTSGTAVLACALLANACAPDDDTPGGYQVDAGLVSTGAQPPIVAGSDAGSVVSTDSGVVQPGVGADARVEPQPVKDASTVNPVQDTGVVDSAVASDAGPVGSDAGPAQHVDLGKGDGKDVIAIGDSWMSLGSVGIQQSLLKASGQKYRTYGVPGTKLLDEVIPRQYASAKQQNPDIKTVVMTGGGNDILLGLSLDSPMTVIDKVGKRLDTLWTEMGKDGVKDVVYIEYSEGGNNGDNVRYGIEKVGPICKNHTALRCHFLLSDPIIMKMLRDGIHPTDKGYDAIGKAIFDLMGQEGMRR